MTQPISRLQLIHGRTDPKANMAGWGFNGSPLDNVAWFHITYNEASMIGFLTREDADKAHALTGWKYSDDAVLMPETVGDLLQVTLADGTKQYFGDWELQIGPAVK